MSSDGYELYHMTTFTALIVETRECSPFNCVNDGLINSRVERVLSSTPKNMVVKRLCKLQRLTSKLLKDIDNINSQNGIIKR